jgi:hypothetical protein
VLANKQAELELEEKTVKIFKDLVKDFVTHNDEGDDGELRWKNRG